MVLEATFIVVDNSDWMRNGDFAPSRSDAQQDAVNLLAGAKTQSNPENTVGVLTMAGKGVEVRVAMTSDVGKVLAQSHGARLSGVINLSAGLQVAGLALKHRQNKNQRQRIVVFVGSPIKEDEKDLVKLGKKLKKNSVAVDIVNFGEEAENTPKLEALLNAVNSDDNSHLVTVPPGPHVLSDILLSSPIVQGEDGGGVAPAAGAADVEMGDAGEDMDEEMQLALAMSMSQEAAATEAAAPVAPAGAAAPDLAMFQDASFVQSVLGSLPGVDPTDPRIQSVISALPTNPDKKDDEKPKEGEGK